MADAGSDLLGQLMTQETLLYVVVAVLALGFAYEAYRQINVLLSVPAAAEEKVRSHRPVTGLPQNQSKRSHETSALLSLCSRCCRGSRHRSRSRFRSSLSTSSLLRRRQRWPPRGSSRSRRRNWRLRRRSSRQRPRRQQRPLARWPLPGRRRLHRKRAGGRAKPVPSPSPRMPTAAHLHRHRRRQKPSPLRSQNPHRRNGPHQAKPPRPPMRTAGHRHRRHRRRKPRLLPNRRQRPQKRYVVMRRGAFRSAALQPGWPCFRAIICNSCFRTPPRLACPCFLPADRRGLLRFVDLPTVRVGVPVGDAVDRRPLDQARWCRHRRRRRRRRRRRCATSHC